MDGPAGMIEQYCRLSGYPVPVGEHRFHPTRMWRFDVAFPGAKLAVEIEGGAWTAGRHTRGKGYEADAEKYSEAALLGWRVLRATPGMVNRGVVYGWLDRAFKPTEGS